MLAQLDRIRSYADQSIGLIDEVVPDGSADADPEAEEDHEF